MRKIVYSCLAALVFCTSSCDDLLDVDSTRYVTENENSLSSSKDSVYSILGILRGLQNVADKYVLLGEMRADLLDVSAYTPASIRELNNYTVLDTSSYANPRDYYAIINNCNYFISRTGGANHPLKAEHALAHAIRAWTYMQLACNWGKAYYFTDPLLSVEDAQKEYPAYTMTQLTDLLIADLEAFDNAAYPNYGTIYDFTGNLLFFPVKTLLGDLYLWRGASTDDYEKAASYYAQYIDGKPANAFSPSIRYDPLDFTGSFETAFYMDGWTQTVRATMTNYELITAIQMAAEPSEGRTSQLNRNIVSFSPSQVITDLWDEQSYVMHIISGATATDHYTTGDLRKEANILGEFILPGNDNTGINDEPATVLILSKLYNNEHIMVYRLGLIYLRYAEALNRAGKPCTAFAVLKYGLNPLTFADELRIPRNELADAKPYITVFNNLKYEYAEGIHARGCGDSAYDVNYTIGVQASRDDTIRWVEELICQELALETSFEGNRMQDLMRIALHRNDPSFLATKIAAKHKDAERDRIYGLLQDPQNWFLPSPEK